MRRASPLLLAAALGVLPVAALAEQVGSLRATPSDPLVVRTRLGNDGLVLDAQWLAGWGRFQAETGARGVADGRIAGIARAWWQADVPDLAASLRLGSQPLPGPLVRGAMDVMGFGLAGRLAPALFDYAFTVGRPSDPATGQPGVGQSTTTAWLRQALDGQLALGLHALQQGTLREVGAVLDGVFGWPGPQRLGVVQHEQGDLRQTRWLAVQRFNAPGTSVTTRAEGVVDRCLGVPAPALPAASTMTGGCAALAADASFAVDGRWKLLAGSTVQRTADDASARRAMVGTAWRAPGGAKVKLTLERRERPGSRDDAVAATIAYPLGGAAADRR